jgi:hypothetical protein
MADRREDLRPRLQGRLDGSKWQKETKAEFIPKMTPVQYFGSLPQANGVAIRSHGRLFCLLWGEPGGLYAAGRVEGEGAG